MPSFPVLHFDFNAENLSPTLAERQVFLVAANFNERKDLHGLEYEIECLN